MTSEATLAYKYRAIKPPAVSVFPRPIRVTAAPVDRGLERPLRAWVCSPPTLRLQLCVLREAAFQGFLPIDDLGSQEALSPVLLSSPRPARAARPDSGLGSLLGQSSMIVSAIGTMSASISHFALTPNSAGRTSSVERGVDITRPASRGSTRTDGSRLEIVTQGSVPYSAFSTKSLSAPDSAPQTSPLRPASCRTPA